jgi:hypothetical protein
MQIILHCIKKEKMCFSATASFGAGIVLTGIGIVSLKKVQQRHQAMFASIPLLFAAQQIAEGFVWLSFTNSLGCIQYIAAHIFILFAQVIWPTWVPLSILFLETNATRKDLLKILSGIGIIVSLFLAYCLFTYHIEPIAVSCHILYHQEYPPQFFKLCGLLYLMSTLLPLLFSSVRYMWSLGVVVVASCIFAAVVYRAYFLSVWCFFAALISIGIVLLMHSMTKTRIETW